MFFYYVGENEIFLFFFRDEIGVEVGVYIYFDLVEGDVVVVIKWMFYG